MQVRQASCCAQDLQSRYSRCDFFDPSPSVPIHRFPVVSSFIHQFSQSCWKWFLIFPKVNPHIHIYKSTIWGICFENVVGISWGQSTSPSNRTQDLLVRNFNEQTVPELMCTNTVNVGWDGQMCPGSEEDRPYLRWKRLEIPSLFKGKSWTSSNYGFSPLMLQCWEYGMFQTSIYIYISVFSPHPWRWLDSSTWPRTFGWFQFRSQQYRNLFGSAVRTLQSQCHGMGYEHGTIFTKQTIWLALDSDTLYN